MFVKTTAKEEKLCLQEQKRAERQHKQLERLCKASPDVASIVPFWNTWARKTGQQYRRTWERGERIWAIENLGPIEHLAHLVSTMAWHRHHAYILIVATHPGVTCDELTDIYDLDYPNHRMVFRRLNADLKHVGWRFVSYPRGAQNQPWGWELEPIPQ